MTGLTNYLNKFERTFGVLQYTEYLCIQKNMQVLSTCKLVCEVGSGGTTPYSLSDGYLEPSYILSLRLRCLQRMYCVIALT